MKFIDIAPDAVDIIVSFLSFRDIAASFTPLCRYSAEQTWVKYALYTRGPKIHKGESFEQVMSECVINLRELSQLLAVLPRHMASSWFAENSGQDMMRVLDQLPRPRSLVSGSVLDKYTVYVRSQERDYLAWYMRAGKYCYYGNDWDYTSDWDLTCSDIMSISSVCKFIDDRHMCEARLQILLPRILGAIAPHNE